ncbi:MAG: LPXTG cell wall anchor domain-containing protein [Defluviitaleaceae bacterium]|nr:LPXTG cell wall anchor domain-containing protein [Defluviitaleaceae bacterium]
MRKAMMRKFIAAVLAFAMVLSSGVTVFAGNPSPTPPPQHDWSGRNPNTPISLTVHHLLGLLPTLVAPGSTTAPGTPQYVHNAIWRMIRIEVPVDFSPATITDPPGAAGSSTLEGGTTGVRTAIINGEINPTPTTAPSGTQAWAVTGHPGFYVTSTGTTATAVPADGIPGVVGAHQTTTGTTGLAQFTSAMLTEGGAPAHGLWLVWEVYNENRGSGVGESTNPQLSYTERFDIITPFLVNLPTFMHNHVSGTPQWVYDLHIFPKQQTPPGVNKTVDQQNVVILPGNRVRIPWNIEVGMPTDIENLLINDHTVEGHRVGDGHTVDSFIVISDELFGGTVADPNLGALLLEMYDPAGSGPTNSDTNHILTVTFQTGAGATPTFANLPRMDGSTPNWSLTVTGGVAGTSNQLFVLRLYEGAIQQMSDDGLLDGNGVLRVSFNTILTLDEATDWNYVTNVFDLNYGTRPTYNFGDNDGDPNASPTPGPTIPAVEVHDLVVRKVNPSNVALNGAVFFLFCASDVTAGVPDAGAEPVRVAISGGVAGSTITAAQFEAANISGLALATPTYRGVNIANIPARTPAPSAGHALFFNLPIGTYYLLEVIAPLGSDGRPYRRIEAAQQLSIVGIESQYTPSFVHDTTFTNTRDFVLPMTGGAGTIAFTAAGVSLMGIAGLFLFLARKKDKGSNVRPSVQ